MNVLANIIPQSGASTQGAYESKSREDRWSWVHWQFQNSLKNIYLDVYTREHECTHGYASACHRTLIFPDCELRSPFGLFNQLFTCIPLTFRRGEKPSLHTGTLSLSLSMSKIQNKFLKIRKAPLCVLGWPDRRLASGPVFCLWYLLTGGTPSPCCITVTSGFMRKWRSTCLFTSYAVIRLSLWSFLFVFFFFLSCISCFVSKKRVLI